MYKETLVQSGVPAVDQPTSTNKVNAICNAFIDILRNKNLSKYMQNIITAYCCKSPPDHEAALNLISSLKGNSKHPTV